MLATFPDSHLLSFQDLQNSLGMRRVLAQFYFNFAVYENVMRWVGPENGAKSACSSPLYRHWVWWWYYIQYTAVRLLFILTCRHLNWPWDSLHSISSIAHRLILILVNWYNTSCTEAFLYHNTTCTNDVTHKSFFIQDTFWARPRYCLQYREEGKWWTAGRGLGMRLHITHTKNKF